MNINQETVDIIKDFLVKKINPIFIYIFGSSVCGNFNDDSDIDIGFFKFEDINSYELFLMQEELADTLKRDVDLINLKNSTTVFKAQVVGFGELIYQNNENIITEFRIRSLKEYAKLNEERKIIIDKMREEIMDKYE